MAYEAERRTVAVYDVTGRRQLHLLEGHHGGITSVAFCNDGKTLATGADDRHLILWDLRPGTAKVRMPWAPGRGQHFVLAWDGSLLASGGLDQAVRVWQAPPEPLPGTWSLQEPSTAVRQSHMR